MPMGMARSRRRQDVGQFPSLGSSTAWYLALTLAIWSVILSTWVWMLGFKVLVGEKLLLAFVTQDPAAGQ
ncbi:uncharacterized protein FPRO_08044 [Fusarium proliferatum ET1]|uniref:Uncharacterized protein n=1 Tax=Fusarium proliferatum (strain ET1) TaxID=1227346 RepID=A0A1L7VT72_FUSPR|nr:uncharacterized protein FPRO_08044 [Fusarium proliferatum ET1]CZR43040.1 uncharacterized protein FPRO_08044 [Fusarium proliferatum ET1]